jgi:hypothetical protein
MKPILADERPFARLCTPSVSYIPNAGNARLPHDASLPLRSPPRNCGWHLCPSPLLVQLCAARYVSAGEEHLSARQ